MPKAKTNVVKTQEPRFVFLVNPGGAVHDVTVEHARVRLRRPGWRVATAEEIAQYKAQEIQRADQPIAAPWKPEEAELDLIPTPEE